jgi:hypothetical protein
MDLLERYLQAVRFFLPRRRQDEIIRELSANLLLQMEDRERALGRALTDDERADVLRHNGHPLVVAGQYQPRNRLIGPVFFHLYLRTLAAALGVTLLVTVGFALAQRAAAGAFASGLAGALEAFPGRGLLVFASTTLAFGALDVWHSRRQAGARASRERDDAQAIQRALLPASLPVVSGWDLAARWQPASDFGGDYYDVVRLSQTTVSLSIADVCGKGLPAALVMSSLQASVRAFASSDPAPDAVASKVNQALCRNAELGRYVTFFYGVYDSTTRRLIYSNAGHNPPALIRSDGSVVRLTAGGMVLGLFENAAFERGELVLEPGDRLVLFTDGITEAESAAGADFGDNRLIETVRRHRAAAPASIVRALFDEVAIFAGGRFEDDATAIAVAIE